MRQSYLKAHHFLFILARIIVVDSVRRTAPASSGQSPHTPQHQVPGASDPPQGRRGPDLPPLQLSSTWHAHDLGPLPPCQAPCFFQKLHRNPRFTLCARLLRRAWRQRQEEIPEDDRSVYNGEGRRRLGACSHRFLSASLLLTSLGQIKQEVLVSHVPEGRLVAVLCFTIISHQARQINHM